MEELETAEPENEAREPLLTSDRRPSFWLTASLLLAFALRILLLDEQSIWWDEGISLHLATSSLVEIFVDRLNNIHPPFYFILLKGWLSLVGVSAFAGRFWSVIASWLQVVVIYAISKRWFSRRTGNAALLLATLSAVSIIYGQEIRAYAVLALNYLLLLAVTRELTQRDGAGVERSKWLWPTLGLLLWLGLHLHYILFFVAAYVSAWALIVFVRQRRWVDFRRWLLVLYLVALASIPWYMAVLRNWTAVSEEAVAGTFVTDPAPLSFLISQVWVFHLTGLAGVLARPGMAQLAGVVAVTMILLILIRLAQRGTRRDTVVLLAHWLIPLSSALVVWTIRSFSHPRYVSVFAPGLILLAAYVAFPPKDRLARRLFWIPNLLAILLYVAIIFTSLVGLWLYFVDPEVAKDDVRGVARYLEATAEVNDIILIPETDWSLPFEYQGEVAIGMPRLDDAEGKWLDLARMTAGIDRVHLVDYEYGTRDWQGMLSFALGKAGTVESTREFDGLHVQSYVLDETISAPVMSSEQVRFGPLVLTGSWIEQDGIAGDGMTVALRWVLTESTGENVQVSLRLLDDAGWPVAADDALLVDESGRPTKQWMVSTPIITYHVVPVPPAVPPFAYYVELQAYVAEGAAIKPLNIFDDQGAPIGQTVLLGQSHVAQKNDVQLSNQDDLPLSPWREPELLAPGLTLLAAEVSTDSAFSGETLGVYLLWQAYADHMPDLRPEVALVQGEVELVINDEDPVYGKYPVAVWSNGEQVFERRGLIIPPDASGAASVLLRVGDAEFELGQLDIQAGEHNFTQPTNEYQVDAIFGDMFRLRGFDLPKTTFETGDVIPVTLVWQSLIERVETEYVVFTHLLDEEGRLIAQHDSPPANGRQITTSWLAGEYITDEHQMSFLESDYRGLGQVEVGLYDPATGDRLQLANGADHLILPVQISIE